MSNAFEVSGASEHGVDLFTLRAGEARARVAPAWGANLFEWTDREPILEPQPLDVIAAKPTSYGIPLLLPFPNRVSGDGFEHGGARYTVDPPRHGFVRSRPWQLVDSGASAGDGAWITTAFDSSSFPELAEAYPSSFRARLTHRLRDRALTLALSVENSGDAPMPLGYGIHPYFRRPANGRLSVPAARLWQLADSLPTGEVIDVDPARDLRVPRDVASLSLDDIYTDLAAGDDGQARCVLTDLDAGLDVVVAADAGRFPHSVIYTAPAPRQALCIEPYTCPTDAFNLAGRGVDADVIELAPGETVDLDIHIAVRDR